MDEWPSIMLIVMVLLLIGSSIASAIETATTACSKIKLQNMADNGKESAKKVLRLKEYQQKILSVTLILNNVFNITLSTVCAIFFSQTVRTVPMALVTILLTVIVLVFGEITPKSLAAKYPENFMMFFCDIINFFATILNPFVMFFNFISNIVLKPFHTTVESKETSITEEEIKTIVDISHKEGVIEEEEKEIIHNIFDFGELTLKDIMVPKIDMKALDINATYDDVLQLFKDERYTRIPIYDGSIDNIVGIVNIKDFFLYDESRVKFKIRDILRDTYYLYENTKISDTLTKMKKTSNNFVVVLDEYGTTSGIVTLEDILEEIVGDIKDEFDQDEDNNIRKIKDNEYIIDGAEKTGDINEKLNISLKNEGDFDTLAGVIIANINHIPKKGEEVLVDGYRLKVEYMENNRIAKVRLFIPEVVEKNDN